MEQLNEFMVNNYIWITIVCLFLIFTLIGYMADKSKNKNVETLEQKKVKPSPVVKKEEIKEIVNNGEDMINKEETAKKESDTGLEIPNKVEEKISNEVVETKIEEPISNTIEENNEDTTQKSLEELMAENDISETSIVSNEGNIDDTTDITEDKEVEEKNEEKINETVNEEIPKNVEVVNSWEPELTIENKDIVPENDDEKKDSI